MSSMLDFPLPDLLDFGFGGATGGVTAAEVLGAVATITNARPPLNTTWQQQIPRGRDDTWTITVTSGGAPLDLVGAEITVLCKQWVGDKDQQALITKTTAGGGVVLSATQEGVFTVAFEPADTWVLAIPTTVDLLAFSVMLALAGEAVDLSPTGASLLLQDSAVQGATPGQILTRGTADTVRLLFTDGPGATGAPYSLAGLSLVWTTSEAGTLTKTQAASQITLSSSPAGAALLPPVLDTATIPLSSTETGALAAGTLAWTLTDVTSGTQLGTGTITVQ